MPRGSMNSIETRLPALFSRFQSAPHLQLPENKKTIVYASVAVVGVFDFVKSRMHDFHAVECQTASRHKRQPLHTPVINDPSRFLLNTVNDGKSNSLYRIPSDALQIDAELVEVSWLVAHEALEVVGRRAGPEDEAKVGCVLAKDLLLLEGELSLLVVHGAHVWDDEGDERASAGRHSVAFPVRPVGRDVAQHSQHVGQIEAGGIWAFE